MKHMKIAITGHTSGIGLALYNHFVNTGHIVSGYSRTTGYSLPDKFVEVCEQIRTCDLFVNNTYANGIQDRFLSELGGSLPVISCGSMAADYTNRTGKYGADKLRLETIHKRIKKISDTPMLLLKMGYLENYSDRYPISYQQIIAGVEFWLKNPRVSMIEFENNPKIYQ